METPGGTGRNRKVWENPNKKAKHKWSSVGEGKGWGGYKKKGSHIAKKWGGGKKKRSYTMHNTVNWGGNTHEDEMKTVRRREN